MSDKPRFYRHCNVSKQLALGGRRHMTTWMDERGAIVGARVELDTAGGAGNFEWLDVEGVGTYRATADEVAGMQTEARSWKNDSSLADA